MNDKRLLEQKYREMKLTYKNLVNANADLVDENKMLKEEIERLNENNQAYQEEVCRVWEERDNLYRRILEAVEYIEKWQSFQHTNGTTHEELKNLKDILKGSDKE